MIDRKMSEKSQGHSDQPAGRRLRAREKRARYIDEFADEEDLFEGRKFDVEEKLNCERFEATYFNCVREVNASDITLEFFQKNGFETPLLVKTNTDNILGMKIPPDTFTVDDVKQCVGSRRILDVMNVETQKDDTMTMKEWCNYYNNKKRDCLLNVISLEFSHTKLEQYVDSPKIVKQMDWVDLVWPKHLKKMQKEGTNALHEMKYPKVQKYCLMSVKGCYTDFHIDFGGTSVWYHILRGKKVFWLIPPTEDNIQQYERWTLSGKQSDIFFADTVPNCSRVYLESGNTFFIPTGWIHAVYTKEDSLVFGGNFLHSFGIDKQLRVSTVEDVTKVPQKFRYPFYTELLWYVLVRYVHCLMGRNYLSVDDEGNSLVKKLKNGTDNGKAEIKKEIKDEIKSEIKEEVDDEMTDEEESPETMSNTKSENTDEIKKESEHSDSVAVQQQKVPFISFNPNAKVYLTEREISGLQTIVRWLSGLSPSKRFVPDLLLLPNELLKDAQKLIDEHLNDDQELSVTGKPSLFWLTKQMLINFKYRASIQLQQKQLSAKPKLPQNNKIISSTAKAGMFTNSTIIRPSLLTSAAADSNQYKVKSGSTLKNDLIPSSFEGLIAQSSVKSGFNPQQSFRPSISATASSVSQFTTSTTATTTSSFTTSPNFSASLYADKLPIHYNTVNQNYQHSNNLPANCHQSLQTTGAVTRPIMSNLMYGYGAPRSTTPNSPQQRSPQHNSFYQPSSPRHPPPPPQPRTVSTTVVKMEHNYNQSPSYYQNPHHHHNYAYHPYQRTPASAAGGTISTTSTTNYPVAASSQLQPQLARTIQPIIVNRNDLPVSQAQAQHVRPQTTPITIVRPVIIRPTLVSSSGVSLSSQQQPQYSVPGVIQSQHYFQQQQQAQQANKIAQQYPNSSAMMMVRPVVVNPVSQAPRYSSVVAVNGNNSNRSSSYLPQPQQMQNYPYSVSSNVLGNVQQVQQQNRLIVQNQAQQQPQHIVTSSHNQYANLNYSHQSNMKHNPNSQTSSPLLTSNINNSHSRTLPNNPQTNSVQQQQQPFFYLNIANNNNLQSNSNTNYSSTNCPPMQSPIIIKTNPAFSVANYSPAVSQYSAQSTSLINQSQPLQPTHLVQLSSSGTTTQQQQPQHLLINHHPQSQPVFHQSVISNQLYAKANPASSASTLPRSIQPQIILTNSSSSSSITPHSPSIAVISHPNTIPIAVSNAPPANYPQYHYPSHSSYSNYQQVAQPSLVPSQYIQPAMFVANASQLSNATGQLYQAQPQQQSQQYFPQAEHNYYAAANYIQYQQQQSNLSSNQAPIQVVMPNPNSNSSLNSSSIQYTYSNPTQPIYNVQYRR